MLNGTSATTIEPGSATTRAQLVTILWRQNGCPTPTRTCSFTDLGSADDPAASWYLDAVAWAAETGVVNGTSATTFDPNSCVSRQETAAILYRYAQNVLGKDVSGVKDISAFPDYSSVSDYARTPMAWAYAGGLITGNVIDGVTCLDPLGNATRAQTAKILMCFCENVA